MKRTSFETMNCSVAQCLEVVGEWWSLLILRDVFMGVRRFDDLQARLGISRNVLTQRLRHLVDSGVLERVPYQQNPPRYEYRLTEKGIDLWPVLISLVKWGDKHAAASGPPRIIEHRGCGGQVNDHLSCDRCGQPLTARDVITRPGPGASAVAA